MRLFLFVEVMVLLSLVVLVIFFKTRAQGLQVVCGYIIYPIASFTESLTVHQWHCVFCGMCYK